MPEPNLNIGQKKQISLLMFSFYCFVYWEVRLVCFLNENAYKGEDGSATWRNRLLTFISDFQSNSTPHSEEDDKHSEDCGRSPPSKYLDESPPHDVSEAFAQQQRELLERLKEQFTTFPFNSHAPNFAAISDQLTEHAHAHQRLQSEAQHDFPFSFPTPPPSKGEDDVKISASAKKSSSQNNNSWSYEDQFKQVRQVSWSRLSHSNLKLSSRRQLSLQVTHRNDSGHWSDSEFCFQFHENLVCKDSQHVFRIPHASLKHFHLLRFQNASPRG